MFWQEDRTEETRVVGEDVLDLSFQIRCRALPVDHAWALSQAILAVLPWIETEPRAGIHTIHVAESGNGWMRPESGEELLYLSRRTRLLIRVPRERLDAALQLVGKTLDVSGHPLTVEQPTRKTLSPLTTIYARYVVTGPDQDEKTFLTAAVNELGRLGVRARKMLCGAEKTLASPGGPIRTRSLMLADLTLPESVTVQQYGLGPLRHRGCGLFLPHKDIQEVGQPPR